MGEDGILTGVEEYVSSEDVWALMETFNELPPPAKAKVRDP